MNLLFNLRFKLLQTDSMWLPWPTKQWVRVTDDVLTLTNDPWDIYGPAIRKHVGKYQWDWTWKSLNPAYYPAAGILLTVRKKHAAKLTLLRLIFDERNS